MWSFVALKASISRAMASSLPHLMALPRSGPCCRPLNHASTSYATSTPFQSATPLRTNLMALPDFFVFFFAVAASPSPPSSALALGGLGKSMAW